MQQLKQVITTLKMFPPSEAVNIAFHAQFIDEDGVLQPNEIAEDAATAMLDELARDESAMWTLHPAHVAAA